MAKNDPFHEGGKVGRSNATPFKFFSVDSYDLKSLSFKFSNDIFIIFEMPRSFFLMSIGKMNISLLFCPSPSEVFEVFVSEDHLWRCWCFKTVLELI